ncbi:MAG: putative sulfate exporter family transporter [Bacteroidetes bacterium]|nr:putative sulfate exporter family transporter [Bacteroidota bacterium]MBU1115750.1 putative sulfate exporter family transporter [Bacteroidota bacterium]MBU1799462.1 putative sulfate exporter family transporter [Bacteroidota bacterium]
MVLVQKKVSLIYAAVIFLAFMPFLSPVLALLIGLFFSLIGIKHENIAKYTSIALQASIVLMGFGMNLTQVISASKTGFFATAISVFFVLLSGILIGRVLKVDSKISLLIASGTAICGGSAIAAVAPVINAKNFQISFSLVVIFILNAIALIIFPSIGHYFNLSQETFGYWSAIAIHDTSSVVGAGATYGAKALEIATTVKLIRALWIIPLSISIAIFQKDKISSKIKIPWFIGIFIIAIIVAYLLPQWQDTYNHLHWLGNKGMVIALFLIGSNISIFEVKEAGVKSFILGVLLWILIGISSFLVLTYKF